MQRPMIEAEGLTKAYGAHVAVHPLDLRVGTGEVVALLGGNGAGKTTIVHMIMGFVAPTAGSARVDGHDVARAPGAARARLAYLPENLALYPHLTGVENLRYFGGLGEERDESDVVLEERLAHVGLGADAARRKLGTYSKGMRQKVGLALALGRNAQALLLDEPLSGLDPKAANELTILLRALANGGVAVLMATHDIFRAKTLADRIGIMRDGRLVAELRSDDVSAQGLEERYLAEMAS